MRHRWVAVSLRALATIAFASVALAAQAEKDTRTPLEAYEGSVGFGRTMCTLSYQVAKLRAENESSGGETPKDGSDDFRGCVQKQKAAIKVAYERALRGIAK